MRSSLRSLHGAPPFALVLALVLAVPALVSAQGRPQIDLVTRQPSLTIGDLLYVRGTRSVRHLETAIGLELDVVRRPFILVDQTTGLDQSIVESRGTATLLFGIGLFDFAQVTLAVPTVFQRGLGFEALTGSPDDNLPGAAVGDIRLDLHVSPLAEPVPIGGALLDVAVAGGVMAPTGETRSFSRSPTFSGYLDLMAHLRYDIFRAAIQSSIRIREDAELAGVHWGSQAMFAGGLAFHIFDQRIVLAAEVMGILGLGDDAANPVLGLIEIRAAVDPERKTGLVLGFGTGLHSDVGAPEWQIIASIRHAPGDDALAIAMGARESAERQGR